MTILPKEKFCILQSSDLMKDPRYVMKHAFEFLELPNCENIQYTLKNQGSYSSKVNESLLSRLYEFYRPHNQRLEEFLGRKFNWD